MKHQFKALAAAAVLALSGAANAAIDTGSTGNGELFFVAYETSTLLTYTADLGKLMTEFTPTATSQSFTLSGFSSFLSSVGAGNQGAIRWGVLAADNTAPRSIYTTGTTVGSNPAASKLANITGTAGSFLAIHNPLGTHASQANGSATYLAANTADFGFGGRLMGNNYNTNTSFDPTGTLGQALNFFSFTNPTSLTSTKTQFKGATLAASTFSVNSGSSTLVFNAPALPVPEPSTYAMALAGLATLGFVARRRSRK